MHIHNVYIWLKENLTDEETSSFEQALKALTDDPYAQSGYYGGPASTDRPVVENTYTYGLVILFDNLAAHDQYQAGPAHMNLIKHHRDKMAKVIVHDIETRGE